MTSSGGGGGGGRGGMPARVPIPETLKKVIQDIKEIAAGKHSDEDIYSMLKECNMDPNDTAQRLLYLDTFHEVRRKRDKKKVDVGRYSDDYRWSSNMQHRGARGGRESYSSSSGISEDSGGRRKGSIRQENGSSNYRGGSSRVPTRVVQKMNDNAVPSVSSGPKNVSNGLSCDTASHVSSGNIIVPSKSPAPPCANISDTAVATITCENVTLGSVSESTSVQNGAKMGASLEVEKSVPTASDTMNQSRNMVPIIPEAINSSHLPEPPNEISSTITDHALVVQNNHSSWPAKQVFNLPKDEVSQTEIVETHSTKASIPQWNDDALVQTTQELNQNVENLSVSSHQPVIFPDHLQVPEAFRRGLTFGSLDATLGQSANSDNVPMPTSESSYVADLVAEEPSKSIHHSPPTVKEGDNSLCPPSHPQMTGTLSSLQDDQSTAGVQKFEQSKQDRLGPAPHITLLQTPQYGYGIMPPVIAPHTTQLEGTETQVSNPTALSTSGSTPPATQPSGLGHNSFVIPPHLLPYLRQPYPSNLIPYNPYFPHLYMPHSGHQFLGLNILPQQPTTGNVHPSSTAAAGSKYAVSPILKSSSLGGNMPHYGVPSGYGSFGASNVGYSSAPAFTSGSSNGTEDLMAAELKENNAYPGAFKQNEEVHNWTTTTGREPTQLPHNYFYNIPPGQHVPFPPPHSTHGPPFPGVYHINQAHPFPAPSSLQSFSQQPQVAGGAIESVVPSSELPHSQINWNTKLLNKENI